MIKPPKANFFHYLRSSMFWLVMAVTVVFIVTTGMLTAVLPFKMRYAYLSLAPRFCIFALKVICGVNYTVEMADGKIPAGPAVVLSKHQSTWETFAFTFLFPPQVWVMKKSLLKMPFFGWGIALLKPIAIDRKAGGQALDQVVSQGRARLDNGIWVVIFPEGTRVASGTRKRFKVGGAKLAAASGYPVLPVAHNAGLLWPRNSFVKFPGTVTVRVGPMIDSKGKTAEQLNVEAETWIEAQMPELEGQAA